MPIIDDVCSKCFLVSFPYSSFESSFSSTACLQCLSVIHFIVSETPIFFISTSRWEVKKQETKVIYRRKVPLWILLILSISSLNTAIGTSDSNRVLRLAFRSSISELIPLLMYMGEAPCLALHFFKCLANLLAKHVLKTQ